MHSSTNSIRPDCTRNHSFPYSVGTLNYSRKGVTILFLWLLWGDFAFNFFESIFSRFMPLYLKEVNASNAMIGIATGSIAGLVNVLFLPNISQYSDRLRTRFGRRIPFLLVMTPLTTLSLVCIGLAPEICGWLQTHAGSMLGKTAGNSMLLLSIICIFTISFHLCNMVLVNAYNWLLRDVVPQVLMARFLSWFRVIGTIATMIFLWFVFPVMLTHRKETFLFVGIFYLGAFLLMSWNVKEGEYPAPEPLPAHSNILTRFGIYFRDCLSVPLYRDFVIAYVLMSMGTNCAVSFITLYGRQSLGLELDSMGKIYAYAALLSAIVYAPVGWLCEKFNELRVTLASIVLMLAGAIAAYFWVTDHQSWFIYSLLFAIPMVGWMLGHFTICMRLFPADSFGQFSSALNVFGCGGLILGNYLCGLFMDWSHSNYRMVFWWSAFFYAAALFPMAATYRGWKKHGGAQNYQPPLPPKRSDRSS